MNLVMALIDDVVCNGSIGFYAVIALLILTVGYVRVYNG